MSELAFEPDDPLPDTALALGPNSDAPGLLAAGLEVGELACRQGMPPQGPKTSLEQRWVDETA